MTGTIHDIIRYPVKGLGPDRLDQAVLTMGEGLPFDRRWALIHETSSVDPLAPQWAKPQNFLRVAKDDRLARLDIQFEEETGTLALLRKGRQVSRGRLGDDTGRTLIQTFLSSFLPPGPRGNPKLVQAPDGVAFTDDEEARLSIINLATIRDLERVTRESVDPIRFRGNLYIDGIDPWSEFDLVGKRLRVGECVLEVLMRIERCNATNVNPKGGAVDMNIPLALRKGFGHLNFGIYCKVVMGGILRPGDSLSIL